MAKKTYRKGQFKPKEYYAEPTSTAVAEPRYSLKTKLILRMDKIMDGSFAGLYQLVSIKETGQEIVLTDANTLQYIILQAHKAIMGAL